MTRKTKISLRHGSALIKKEFFLEMSLAAEAELNSGNFRDPSERGYHHFKQIDNLSSICCKLDKADDLHTRVVSSLISLCNENHIECNFLRSVAAAFLNIEIKKENQDHETTSRLNDKIKSILKASNYESKEEAEKKSSIDMAMDAVKRLDQKWFIENTDLPSAIINNRNNNYAQSLLVMLSTTSKPDNNEKTLAIAKCLLDAGARTNIEDSMGMTALHWAAANNNEALCVWLKEYGAAHSIEKTNVSIHDAAELECKLPLEGKLSASDIAEKLGHRDLAGKLAGKIGFDYEIPDDSDSDSSDSDSDSEDDDRAKQSALVSPFKDAGSVRSGAGHAGAGHTFS
jgi:hypothetical protein